MNAEGEVCLSESDEDGIEIAEHSPKVGSKRLLPEDSLEMADDQVTTKRLKID